MSVAIVALIVLVFIGLLALEVFFWLALALFLSTLVGIVLFFDIDQEVIAITVILAGLAAAFYGIVCAIRWDMGRLMTKARGAPPQNAQERHQWANRTGPYAADE